MFSTRNGIIENYLYDFVKIAFARTAFSDYALCITDVSRAKDGLGLSIAATPSPLLSISKKGREIPGPFDFQLPPDQPRLVRRRATAPSMPRPASSMA